LALALACALVGLGLLATPALAAVPTNSAVPTVSGTAKVGAPYVAGASVKGEVVEPLVKGEKIYIQKFQAKKTWQKKTGHRQRYTLVRVTAINA
jgi:ribosomal protein L21